MLHKHIETFIDRTFFPMRKNIMFLFENVFCTKNRIIDLNAARLLQQMVVTYWLKKYTIAFFEFIP